MSNDLPPLSGPVDASGELIEETPTREWLMKRLAWYARECERQGEIIERQQQYISEQISTLRSIANNSCCSGCQEAALIARAALSLSPNAAAAAVPSSPAQEKK